MPNGPSCRHFWSTSLQENAGGKLEGEAFYVYPSGTLNCTEIVRFYYPVHKHFWTVNEKDSEDFKNLKDMGAKAEGVAFCSPAETEPGAKPVFRFFDGYNHFWTLDPDGEKLPKPAFKREGVAFYAFEQKTNPNQIPVYRFFPCELPSDQQARRQEMVESLNQASSILRQNISFYYQPGLSEEAKERALADISRSRQSLISRLLKYGIDYSERGYDIIFVIP